MSCKLSKTYLFEKHSQQEVTRWATQLRYFYFIRAAGGHANDGDEFRAGIRYTNKDDLKSKLSQLGITVGNLTAQDPQPQPGKAYRGNEFSKFKTPVAHFSNLEQPGHVLITDISLFVWITPQIIRFSVSGQFDGNLYEVSQADFEACFKLETLFDQLKWYPFKDNSIAQGVQCISDNMYPEYFV
ncbi:hypothetical protein ABDD95_20680 [Mucilaginibacter sp. PAMB04274]|uniref:hypothetical protein n=1 Tax=Mucilaginibacter sp. PAMB04274 TaxID=3138568 RepID=UPI0031F6FA3C